MTGLIPEVGRYEVNGVVDYAGTFEENLNYLLSDVAARAKEELLSRGFDAERRLNILLNRTPDLTTAEQLEARVMIDAIQNYEMAKANELREKETVEDLWAVRIDFDSVT